MNDKCIFVYSTHSKVFKDSSSSCEMEASVFFPIHMSVSKYFIIDAMYTLFALKLNTIILITC